MLEYEGIVVKHKGPFARGEKSFEGGSEPSGDQVALRHILFCRTWKEAWKRVREQISPERHQLVEGHWWYDLWRSAVDTQGLEGLEMLRPGGIEILDARFRPQVYNFGRRATPASDIPCMADEVYVYMAGLWGG